MKHRYEFGTKKCMLVNVDKGGRKRYDFFRPGTKRVRNWYAQAAASFLPNSRLRTKTIPN
jgi:hypothetical protein